MQVPYPKSFRKLLLIGFSLVALPLLIALVNNAVSIDRLADKSRHAVYGAVQATESSRALVESITNEERIARQYLVLGEAVLQEGGADVHRCVRILLYAIHPLCPECTNCGYLVAEGAALPPACPLCGAPKEAFVLVEED